VIRVLSEPPWARWFRAAARAGDGHRVNSPRPYEAPSGCMAMASARLRCSPAQRWPAGMSSRGHDHGTLRRRCVTGVHSAADQKPNAMDDLWSLH